MEVENSIVCNKHDIILRKIQKGKTYSLDFNLKNPNIKLQNVINFKLYDLIAELNKDVVEKIEIINNVSDDVMDILFVFKRFGKELGISQKYMVIRSTYEQDTTQKRFLSHSIPYHNEIPHCQKIESNYSNLFVDFATEHDIHVKYEFNMELHEELPSYMENIVGFLMKKIFYRVKLFIENIE